MPDPSQYARRRNALISHLARFHGLVGYDPFPLGTEHHYRTDSRGNVLVHNQDLDRLLSLHDQEGIHGLSTHQHESAAGQESRGRFVSPDQWQIAADQAREDGQAELEPGLLQPRPRGRANAGLSQRSARVLRVNVRKKSAQRG